MIAKRLNIHKENIATVGDSGNDISMFEMSGISFGLKSRSVEMKNAVDIYLGNEQKKDAVSMIILQHLINKNIKLIASDLDGTLLDDHTKLIHNATQQIIRRAIEEKDCKFAIATGRGLDDCLLLLKNMKLKPHNNLFVIGANGSFIYDCTYKNYLYQKFMNENSARGLCECLFEFRKKEHNGKLGAQIFVKPNLRSNKKHTVYLINKKVVLEALSEKTPYFLINN
jgi:hydroxymethylpyrimidine pyrophosphatase-like HAD family hydrolase